MTLKKDAALSLYETVEYTHEKLIDRLRNTDNQSTKAHNVYDQAVYIAKTQHSGESSHDVAAFLIEYSKKYSKNANLKGVWVYSVSDFGTGDSIQYTGTDVEQNTGLTKFSSFPSSYSSPDKKRIISGVYIDGAKPEEVAVF